MYILKVFTNLDYTYSRHLFRKPPKYSNFLLVTSSITKNKYIKISLNY